MTAAKTPFQSSVTTIESVVFQKSSKSISANAIASVGLETMEFSLLKLRCRGCHWKKLDSGHQRVLHFHFKTSRPFQATPVLLEPMRIPSASKHHQADVSKNNNNNSSEEVEAKHIRLNKPSSPISNISSRRRLHQRPDSSSSPLRQPKRPMLSDDEL
jgi:hypothetical protein